MAPPPPPSSPDMVGEFITALLKNHAPRIARFFWDMHQITQEYISKTATMPVPPGPTSTAGNLFYNQPPPFQPLQQHFPNSNFNPMQQ
jgi:hypothetical protein